MCSSDSQTTSSASWDEDPKLIYALIGTHMWGQLWNALNSRPGSKSKLFRPVMHFACKFHCPLDIIQLIDEKFPHSIASADTGGKWPIHYACEFGTPCATIKYLAGKDPRAAGAQDIAGMTPTHYLCKYYVARHQPNRDGGRSTKECMLDAMKNLVRTAPSSLNLEDKEGMNAIEYAIDSEVDIRVLRALQKGSEKQNKKEASEKKREKRSGGDISCSNTQSAEPCSKASVFAKATDLGNRRMALLCASRTQSKSDRAVAA